MKGMIIMKGIDVSNHNGNINWSKVKADGVEVVYIKATEGTTYQDQWLNSHYAGAKGVGLSTGFYHFLVGTSQPESQAHNFYNQIKDKKNDLIPCLDIEVSGFDVGDYAIRFLKKFKELSGMNMVIYTGAYFSRDNLPLEIKQNYPLWLAHYGVEPWKSNLVTLAGFTTLVGHQYTEKGRIQGINGVCDLNVFNNGVLLGKSTSTQPQTSVKATGKVAELQGLCNSILGTNLAIDNIYGPETDSAVRKLPLCGLPYVQRELTKWIQLRLGLVPDGIFGQRTKEAVIAWQYRHGLVVDGIVGYNTYKSLALA